MESILCSPNGFGLTTATPVQRAICRASDGMPMKELWRDPNVRAAFGGVRPPDDGVPPSRIVILAAIRCGKSLFCAAKAVQISQSIDLDAPFISAGDGIRVPIVSVDLDKSKAVFGHLIGQIQSKPALRQLMVGEPSADSFYLRHPSGRPIEVCTTALSRSGSTLVARWLPALIVDEAPLIASVSDAKRNLDETLGAVAGRILPGGQIMLVGSPWGSFGPIFDLVAEKFGKPTRECVVIRATGPVLNPYWYTPETCARLQLEDPAAYKTNVLAEFQDATDGIFASVQVEAATRAGPVVRPHVPGHQYVAAMDPAFRGNAWTFVLLECIGTGGPGGITPMYSVAMARQWIGSKANPLKANVIMGEISEICREYGVESVVSDQHNVDTITEFADLHGIGINAITITSANRLEMVEKVNAILGDGRLELPPDRQFATDLKSARKRITQNGVTLVLPRSGDGRHADFVPSLALAFIEPPGLPDEAEAPEKDDMQKYLDRMREAGGQNHWENMARRVSGS